MFFFVKSAVTYDTVIDRSRFIGNVSPARTADEARTFVSMISKSYRDSSHNCWGYIVGVEGDTYHYSDDGEPNGTAGKPIYGVLQKYCLTNTVIVVTRYFGGVKLGVRGLIEAYRSVADGVINRADVLPLIIKDVFEVTTPYKYWEILQHKLKVIEDEASGISTTDNRLAVGTMRAIEISSIEYTVEVKILLSANHDLNLYQFLEREKRGGNLQFRLKESYY